MKKKKVYETDKTDEEIKRELKLKKDEETKT